ncbi:MAG TPA: hypothetical protein VJN43_07330 [Bryobacteraceae bacterium]|nr:hypothetical protein [Bryobacteraceae bacterium]
MSEPVTRRQVLQAAASALPVGLAASNTSAFLHRAYLGWITDLDSRPDTHAPWPSMRLDLPLLEDYRRTFALMKRLGYNAIVIWGFYVSRSWPADIASAVPAKRGALVSRLIDGAHEQGIRVYTGLGVYSWGFEEIIRQNPGLSRGNPSAMCASRPEAWDWMRKVIDFAMTRFPVDGASLQSADQGRCNCDQCRRWTDTEYHTRLDIRVSEYIRAHWPGKTVAVSGWGMRFDDPASLPALVELSRHIDYLIDVRDSARQRDPSWRRKLIHELKCSFGTLGGPQVEPPQHFARDRWFLPTVRRDAEHLAELHGEGGRACEYFFHILENPGDEVSFWVEGKTLRDPATPWREHLAGSIEELYGTRSRAATEALSQIFLRAEEAYLNFLPSLRSGTISIEPLVEDHPGPPVYITRRLTAAERGRYRDDLKSIEADLKNLAADVPEKTKLEKISRCLTNAMHDIDLA